MVQPSRLPPLLRAMRPRQWIKNLLVAAAPAAATALDHADVVWRTALAIVCFTAAASAVYLRNDAADVVVDRSHPTKRLRPVAAGEVSTVTAHRVSVLLGVVAVVVGTAIAWPFGVVLVAYVLTNLAYSAGVKSVPYVELVVVASGFLLRAIGGGLAAEVDLSVWFVLVVGAGSLFVVLGKRSAELDRTAGTGGRPVLARYTSPRLHGLRAACALVAVVAYALWVVQVNTTVTWLSGLSLVAFAGALFRYSRAIDAGAGEDPEDIILGDRSFQLAALAWLVVYAGALYG